MVTKRQLPDTATGRRARLNYLICLGFAELDADQRDEVEALIEADVNDWRENIAGRLREDVVTRRRTRRALAEAIGVHETYLGRVIADPPKLSERVIGLLSIAVPGYADVYAEFRRRADQLYLPATEQALAAVARDAERLNEINRELQAAIAALEALREMPGKAGKNDA